MRLRLNARIAGRLYVTDANTGLSAEEGGVLYELRATPTSLQVTHVSVSVQMTDHQVARMRNVMKPSAPGWAPSLEISGIDEVTSLLEQRLRWLEGRLSFGTHGEAIDSINVWECEFEFIAENPPERDSIAVTSFQVTEAERTLSTVRVGVNFFGGIVRQLRNYDDELAILQGFYREARNHFCRGEHIEAFHDYYFVIEGFFADGKSSEKEVMKTFLASDRLHMIANRTLVTFRRQPKQWEWIRARLEDEQLIASAENLLRLLFRVRGDLRHFSPKTPRKVVTPYDKREFRTAALVVMYMATLAVEFRMADLTPNPPIESGGHENAT